LEVSLSVSLSVFTTRTVGPCYERAPAPVLCATVVRVVGRGATRLKTFPSESESCTCANPGGQPRTLFLVQYVYTPAITHDRRLTLPGPYTPHPTPRTLHHASYTTHPTPRTLHHAPPALHPTAPHLRVLTSFVHLLERHRRARALGRRGCAAWPALSWPPPGPCTGSTPRQKATWPCSP